MTEINFDKLLQSVTYYLSYQNRIGRDFMINESSLKYPVADYLSSLNVPVANIQLEFSHPDLFRRNIDLVIMNGSGQRTENAFEFKMVKPDTRYEGEKKRIFNDLMRLHLMNKSGSSHSYFLIAGTQSDFIQCFRSIITKKPIITNKDSKDLPAPEGFYTEWFGFEPNEEKLFDVKGVTGNGYEKIYDSFSEIYSTNERSRFSDLPKSIKTSCIAITALSRDFTIPYVGGIWKVE